MDARRSFTAAGERMGAMTEQARVLIAGMGKLGTVLGRRLHRRGVHVAGIRRNAGLIPHGITPIGADLSRPGGLAIPGGGWDAVACIVSAQAFNQEAYRLAYVESLKNLLAALDVSATGRIIFVSSSAVYGHDDGSWVDENSPTRPRHFNGTVMLEAERLALQTGIGTVVRFSGIYGPGRTRLLRQVRERTVAPSQPVVYGNRIHSADCIGVLDFLIDRALRNLPLDDVYLASDCEPAPQAEVQRWLASRLGIDPQTLIEQPALRRAGSKRLRNARLLNAGYRFVYPGYREGYRAVIAGTGDRQDP